MPNRRTQQKRMRTDSFASLFGPGAIARITATSTSARKVREHVTEVDHTVPVFQTETRTTDCCFVHGLNRPDNQQSFSQKPVDVFLKHWENAACGDLLRRRPWGGELFYTKTRNRRSEYGLCDGNKVRRDRDTYMITSECSDV